MNAFRKTWCVPGLLGAVAVLLLAACDSPTQPGARIPTELQLASGDAQVAVVGQPLADSLEVRVLDQHREPLAGVEVEFTVSAGEGTTSPEKVRTDARGLACVAWTLGAAAGEQTVEARVSNRNLAPVVFHARATAGAAAALVKVSGDGQSGTVGEPLPEPLVVRVSDAYGNAVPGVEVQWTTESGSLSPQAAQTDEAGHAQTVWTLGTVAGSIGPVIATIEADSASFTAAAVPGPVARIELTMTPASNDFLHPATARLEAAAWDTHQNPVSLADFVWSSSDPAVAAVVPDAGSSSRATMSTRAAGTTRLSASSAGLTESVSLRVAEVEGSYLVTNTGLWEAAGLNDRGEVVGHTRGDTAIAVWRDGETVIVLSPQTDYSVHAVAINNQGAIAFFQGSRGYPRPGWPISLLIFKEGSVTRLPTPGFIRDINDSDAVVGIQRYSWKAPPEERGFLWHEGRLTLLWHVSIQFGNTNAVAVNDRLQVAVNMVADWAFGISSDPQVGNAYLWEAGQYMPIPRPDPACQGWVAVDLNNLGRVLLNCGTGGSATAAFIWDGTTMTSLAPLTRATSFNDHGEVVGWGPDGFYRWRNGVATRLVNLPPNVYARNYLINNVGQILYIAGGSSYLLVPQP